MPQRIRPGEASILPLPATTAIAQEARRTAPAAGAQRSEILPREEARPESLHRAWQAGSPYNQRYQADQAETFSAVVEAVQTFVPADGAEPGLLLRVIVGGQERLIHVAPLRSLREQGTRFNYRDSITVRASPTQVSGQTVYLAQTISRGASVFEFREAQTGRPLWGTPATP
ncbi:MAG: hypothetical protein AAGC44_14225 [Planctomycetota bacterium]